MKKSKLASGLAGGGGVLALALGLSMATSQVAAVPYASQIRFSETQINQFLGTDLQYTLNEDADAVTVEVYNLTDAVVVRTYNFTSPDPETTRGRHAISWDNRDELNNLLPLSADQLTIRVRVQKSDSSTTWTPITSNSSGKATQQQSIFDGFSSNDLKIPTDPTADQFGLMFASHSYNGAPPGGLILFGTDLAPVLGNGGGAANVRGQHPAASPGNFGLWKTAFDPLDPDLLWFGGQTSPSKAGFVNIGATNPADIDLNLTESWATGLFPRGFAVGLNDSNQRIAYIAMGNALYRAQMDTVAPYTLSGEEVLTAALLDGVGRYGQETKVDAAGNVYFLNRLPDGDGRLWRWDKATVDAAPGVLLDETNAAWAITAPAGSNHFNALHIDPLTGEVFVGNAGTTTPRGVYRVGNTSEATITKLLTADDLILDYTNATLFPVAPSGSSLGHGISTDWKGNFYVTNRIGEEIYSFSPPARASVEDPPEEYDITTATPTGYAATVAFDKSNLVFVDQDATPDGVVNFTSVREAILSFGPGGQNNGFAGTNRIEVRSFGPFDEELPDLTGALDADGFEIVTTNGPALVLQQGSSWVLGADVTIEGLVIASSNTSTPTGTLVSSTSGTQSLNNTWIGALPANANTYTAVGDIPADLVDGSRLHDHAGVIRAGDGLTISGATVTGTDVVITQHVDGVDISSGSLSLSDSTVSANMGTGANGSGGSLTLDASSVINNSINGVTGASTTVEITGASQVSNNGAVGIAISGSGSLLMNSTFANPNEVVGNTTAGITYSSSLQYRIRNTLIHGSGVGLDLLAGAYEAPFFNYDISDVIISGSTTAGIRTSSAQGISAARITLFDNGSGVLDLGTRGGLWSLELQDSIIAGAGDTGINSPGAGDGSILLDFAALVTAGPDALASASNAPAAAFDIDFGQVAINADAEFRSTTYSSNRSGPDFFMAPTSLDYVGAAKPNAEAYAGGSPFQNLGGGSRWTLGPGLSTITVGTSGTQLYTTLADAVDAVNSLGTTGSEVLTILIETDLLETRVSRLGIEGANGGVVIRPMDGADVTVSWETSPPLSGSFYSGQLALGVNQGVSNDIVVSENIVIDGSPAGSPVGTQLTFQGPGRHINLTGGAKGAIIRNMNFISTASSGAVIRTNPVRIDGVDHHPDNAVIENNLINTSSATGSHVAIDLSFQTGDLTSATTGMQILNNRIEYNSSAIFIRTSHDMTIAGNEFYGKMPTGGFQARGIMYIIGLPTSQTHTDNIYNNVMDVAGPTTSAVIGLVPIYIEPTGENMITFNVYNNMISSQLTGPGGLTGGLPDTNSYYGIHATAGSNHTLNALHNSIHLKLASTAPFTGMSPAESGAIAWRAATGSGTANIRNNLVRIEEPQAVAFVYNSDKAADVVEDYNTVYRRPIEIGEPPVEQTPNYGYTFGDGVVYPTLAAWQAGTGKGANSDEAVIEIAPETNPAVGFDGVWTTASDRTTDPNNPIMPDLRWTAVPGDSSVWAGVPGLLTNLPGGNADIDGTVRSSLKTYRGAHEAALMPGDAIPPDEEPPAGILGDVTGDELVNVADVTALADALANGTEGEISLVVGDIDDDGNIDADDLAALVDMIVNP